MFNVDIGKAAEANGDVRQVHSTGPRTQIVVMTKAEADADEADHPVPVG